jgi:hypothetical protein
MLKLNISLSPFRLAGVVCFYLALKENIAYIFSTIAGRSFLDLMQIKLHLRFATQASSQSAFYLRRGSVHGRGKKAKPSRNLPEAMITIRPFM